jgi:hypothetical protein
MWRLHQTLKTGIGKAQEYLIDEILEMMDGISTEDFLSAILLLYPKIDLQKHNPVELATLFVAGLKRNEFFAFVDLTQGITNGSSNRQ